MKGITSVEVAEKRLADIQNLKTAKYDELRLKLREYIAANKEAVVTAIEGGKEEQKVRQGSIKALEEEISKLREKISLVTDSEARSALNLELKNLEYRLSIMKLTTAELKSYNDLMARSGRGATPLPAIKNNIQGKVTTTQDNPIKGVISGMDATGKELESFNDKLDEEVLRSADIAADFGRTVAQSFSDSMRVIFDAIASGEKIDSSDLAKALLMPFADMAVQIGEVLIASGVGAIAAKALIKNPYTAIAAGAALVAIGTAAQAAIGSIGANLGKSGGSGNYTYGTGGGGIASAGWQPQMAAQKVELNLTGVLKGQDIYLAVEKAKNNRLR